VSHEVKPAASQQAFGGRVQVAHAPVAIQRQEAVGQTVERGAVGAGREAGVGGQEEGGRLVAVVVHLAADFPEHA